MEKIGFPEVEKLYNVKSIDTVSGNLLKIVFADENNRPDNELLTDTRIKVFTQGGIHVSTLSGYKTVYREENDGLTVYLSNDGSVWTETPELPPEDYKPYEPTEEERLVYAISAKKTEVNSACKTAIMGGIDVELSDGNIHHFDLTYDDQLAMLLCATDVAAGVENIPWHPNSSDNTTLPCEFYSNADMLAITTEAKKHITYHQTYCNSLKIWVESCTTVEAVEAIYYGSTVPVEYQSDVLKTALTTA